MSDRYYPGYDRGRRGSSPGRSWNRLPPDRPAIPPRSFTAMDPRDSRDPRRANYNSMAADPRKRIASRSPEGAQVRKQQRQDGLRDSGATTPNNLNDSRRSSLSNAPANSRPLPSGTAPKPPGQPPNMMRKPSDAPASSPRSPHDTLNSGRSTPQQRSSSLTKDALNQTNGLFVSNDSMTDPNSISSLLAKFSTEIASRAALEQEKRLAESHYTNAQQEYNQMRKHFVNYPATKERKGADREIAQRNFKSKEKLLNEHVSSQESTIEGLSSLLGLLVQPQGQRNEGGVSRAEYDTLQRNYLDLKEEVSGIQQLRRDIEAAKQHALDVKADYGNVGKAHREAQQVKDDIIKLLNWKKETEPSILKIDSFDKRLEIVTERSNVAKQALDELKNKQMPTLATKEQVTKLGDKYDSLDQKVGGLQKTQAKAVASSVSAQDPAKNQAVNSVSKDSLESLKSQHDQLVANVKLLQDNGEERINANETKINELTERFNVLGNDVTETREALEKVEDSIEEEGKEPIVKRVKKLDVLVNNISSQVMTDGKQSLTRRLSQLEKDYDALQKDLQATKNGRSTPAASSTPTSKVAMDLKPLEDRLTKVEGEVNLINEGQKDRDAALEEGFDELQKQADKQADDRLSQLQADVDGRLQPAYNHLEQMRERLDIMQATINGVKEAAGSHASLDSVESLQKEMKEVSEEVKKLQSLQERAKATSQPPQPPAFTTQNGQRATSGQFSPHPQQMPNGVHGSPHVNGGPQFSPPSHGHGPQQQAQDASIAQQVQQAQMQINGLVAVTQQLKMRCDNLQTDEIVRAMVDQLSSMYPEAKNFNNAVQHLRNSIGSLEQKVASLQDHSGPSAKDINDEVKKAAANAQGARSTVQGLTTDLQKVWTEINNTKSAIETLEREAMKNKEANGDATQTSITQKSNAADDSLDEKVKYLRDDLTKTHDIAHEANRLSKQHASCFSKIEPERLKTRVATLESTVDEHTAKMREGTIALTDLSTSVAEVNSKSDRALKRAGQLVGRVERLENEAND